MDVHSKEIQASDLIVGSSKQNVLEFSKNVRTLLTQIWFGPCNGIMFALHMTRIENVKMQTIASGRFETIDMFARF